MFVTEILVFSFVLIVARLIWINRRYIYLSNKIPNSNFDVSPKGIVELVLGDGKVLYKMIDEGLNKTTLTKTFFGPMVMINITSPEDAKIIFNSKECLGKPHFTSKFFTGMSKGSLFGSVTHWQSHRKILNPYFGAQSLRSVIPIFNKKVNILMKNFAKVEGKGEFNVFHHMTALTLETILSVMEFEKDIQNQETKSRDVFISNLEKYIEAVITRSMKFWLHFDFIYQNSSVGKMEKEARSNCAMIFTPDILKETREKMIQNNNNSEEESSGKQKTFIRALVDPKSNLPEDELYEEISTLILAAQDTSAIASSASLLLLAMHKDKQNKVVEELKHVFGTSLENLSVDVEQINELHYLDMVINEAMRLIPVVPLVARKNQEDIISSEGYVIPAKSNLIIPIFKIHRNEALWGEDAHEFRPERFSKENIENIHPYAFIPFAKGARMCVGWRYATYLMKIQLANILLRYELDTTLKLSELDFKLNITLTVCQGFQISIRDRKL